MTEDEERREFRRFVRDHHPDRGGDPEAFLAGLARFRSDRPGRTDRSGRTEAPANVVFYRRPRGLGRLTASWRRLHHRHRAGRHQPPRVI